MKIKLLKKHTSSERFFSIIFFIALIVGIFSRIYNLSWGAPYFFHPDERNIASSISQLSYIDMNPHFFAYGTLPIYSIYYTGVTVNFIQNLLFHTSSNATVNFELSIIIGRVFSCIFSILIIFLVYYIGSILSGKRSGIIGAALASLSVGYIQSSHNATFEMWLSFFTLLLSYLLIKYFQKPKISIIFLISIIAGILISIKISSLILIPLTFLIIIFASLKNKIKNKHYKYILIKNVVLKFLFFLSLSTIVLYISSPYFFIDSISFLNSMHYESNVALGSLPVFYTQSFIGSYPILYQLTKVYPFILNPFILIAFIFFLPPLTKELFKNKNYALIILFAFFLVTFFSQTFLFVKWVRYYIPTLAFIYILLGFFIDLLISKNNNNFFNRKFGYAIFIFLLCISCVYSYAYFRTVLAPTDTRIAAATWAKNNIPHNARLLSEIYDLGILPFNATFPSITLFNFYELDSDPQKEYELQNALESSDYLILPSQRILQTRINDQKKFPLGNAFYTSLFASSYIKMLYKSPCDIFCRILYLGSRSIYYEQTASVFDRPEVYIFKYDKKENYRIQK